MSERALTQISILLLFAAFVAYIAPRKDDSKPEPPQPKANITAQAKASVAAYALCLSANATEAADKVKSGELKNSDAAYKWLAQQNESDRKESFKGWGEMLDEAIKAERLEAALRESAGGFGKVK